VRRHAAERGAEAGPRAAPPLLGAARPHAGEASVTDRRKAREVAVQTLYEIAHTEEDYPRALAANLERRTGNANVQAHAERLLATIAAHRDEIAALLTAALENWTLERVAMVDRCVMEVACAEILFCSDVPVAVAIDEAVQIARKFSTEESGPFVNGVLDRVVRTQGEPRPAGE
jgi:transcription antitermination protein NusB